MAAPFLATPNLLVPTAVGIGLSGFFSGANFALTYISVPALLLPAVPSHSQAKVPQQSTATSRTGTSVSLLARQWRFAYNIGKATFAPFALLATICFMYVAWGFSTLPPSNVAAERSLNGLMWTFVAAASFAISVVPWTLAAMKRTNDILFERAEKADAMAGSTKADASEAGVKDNERGLEGMTTEKLIRWWGVLNLI